MLLQAKYVVPVSDRPIKNGAVRIDGEVIGEVGTSKSVDGGPVVNFGNAAILPGFINGHTHLELTWAEGGSVRTGEGFFDWLERLVGATRDLSDCDEVFAASAREGMRRSLSCGVTTVGDVTSRPSAVRSALRHGPLRVVSFGEVIAMGTLRGQLSQRLQAAADGSCASQYLTIGVSPHSPYTVESEGIQACVETGERLGLRMCMHLAETPDEARYTECGDGPCREYLEKLNVWDDLVVCPKMPPVPLAYSCAVLGSQTLLAHCNYASPDDVDLLVATGAHVAYCPRTHAAFEHEPHPYREMLAAGVNVCMGTDSLASNPSLSVLDEIRFLRRIHPEVAVATLLEMATMSGAEALGLGSVVGSLTAGKSADITVVPLDPDGPVDPIENLLASSLNPVATFVRGKRVRF